MHSIDQFNYLMDAVEQIANKCHVRTYEYIKVILTMNILKHHPVP